MAHRDLKPENICFCSRETSQVKIIDWGLSSDFLKGRMKTSVGSATYSAPEVMEAHGHNSYTVACDCWSLGVLTYVMLCGKPPFFGSPLSQLRNMKAEKYLMDDGVWRLVSESAKDFIRHLLKADPLKRMTMDDALSHAFLKSCLPDEVAKEQIHSVLSNMLQFSTKSLFYSLVMSSAARHLNDPTANFMGSIFSQLDSNHDGVLDMQEMRQAFAIFYGEDVYEKQLELLFRKLNFNGTDKLTYTQFSAAGMGDDVRNQEQVLWSSFKVFDDDNDGIVSQDDIEHLLARADGSVSLSMAICENAAREVLEAYDSNGDGGVDFEEFKLMVQSCARQTACHPVMALEKSLRADVSPATTEERRRQTRGWTRHMREIIARAKSAIRFRSKHRRVTPETCVMSL